MQKKINKLWRAISIPYSGETYILSMNIDSAGYYHDYLNGECLIEFTNFENLEKSIDELLFWIEENKHLQALS